MKASRARRRLCVSLATAAIAVAFASGAQARNDQAPAHVAATCTAEQKAANAAALDAYLKRMARDRRAYFRKHRHKAHRRAFVKRQQAKLKALRAAAACQVQEPAPTPSYQPGHYAGKTSQNENFAFDVSADRSTLMNLVTGQINESCNGFNLFGGNLRAPGPVTSISSDGNFTIRSDSAGQFGDGTPYEDHLTITGHLSGTSATGTLLDVTNFTTNATAVSCTSNPQTWSASRIG